MRICSQRLFLGPQSGGGAGKGVGLLKNLLCGRLGL